MQDIEPTVVMSANWALKGAHIIEGALIISAMLVTDVMVVLVILSSTRVHESGKVWQLLLRSYRVGKNLYF